MKNRKSIHIAYGELNIAGESIGLYHAHARRTDDGGIHLLISNAPVTPNTLLDSVMAGLVHALEFRIRPEGTQAASTVWSNRLPLLSALEVLEKRALQYLSPSVITGFVPSRDASIAGIPFRYSAQYATELEAPAIAKAA